MKKKKINKNDKKNLIIGLGAFILYIILLYSQTLPFDLLGVSIESASRTVRLIYSFIYEILIACLLMMIFYKPLVDNLKNLKENHKEYFSKCVKYWLIGISASVILNYLIIAIFKTEIPNNEQAVRALFNISPIYMFLSAVVIAPITEELVFRKSFRNMFKSNLLFILMSGLVFGGLHVISSAETWVDFVYVLPYAAPGMAFAYMVTKTENVLVPICFHAFHNGILISLQFLLLFLS